MGYVSTIRWSVLTALVLLHSSCTVSPQAKESRFLALGKEQLAKKDYTRAALQFRNAAQAAPHDAEPNYQLALACLAQSDFGQGIAFLRKAIALNPKHEQAQLKLAELMVNTQDKDLIQQAKERAQEVLHSAPDNPSALDILAVSEWSQGDAKDAEQHLQQAIRNSPAHLQSSLALAELKLLQKDFKGAEEVLKQAAAQQSSGADSVLVLANFYLSTRHPELAEAQFHRALQLDVNNGSALAGLAGIQARAHREAEAEQTYRRLSALPDKSYRPLHAIFLFNSGKRDLAIQEFEKLAKENPEDRALRHRLVSAYFVANRNSDAEHVLTQTLKKNARDADALLQRSAIYLHEGKQLEAKNDLSEVLRFKPDSAEAHYLLAKIYEKGGAGLQQRQELNETIRLAPELLPARLELAQFYLRTQAPKSALETLNGAPPSQATALPLRVERNWAYLALNNMAEFRKGVNEALSTSRTPDVLLQDAQYKFIQHDYAGARKSVEEALRQNPEDTRAVRLWVQTYLEQKQPAVAVQKLREYVELHPHSAALQFVLGDLLKSARDFAGARAAFLAAKAADPAYTAADLALAQLDFSEGKIEDARAKLSEILISKPEDISARIVLAGIEERRGNPGLAIEQLRKVIAHDERNVIALNDLAYLLAEYANKPDEGLKFAEKAKEIAPENPAISDTLGWVLYKRGLYSPALTHLEYAAAKEPTGRTKYHLAAAYFKLGDRKRGQRNLDEALKMDPTLRSQPIDSPDPTK